MASQIIKFKASGDDLAGIVHAAAVAQLSPGLFAKRCAIQGAQGALAGTELAGIKGEIGALSERVDGAHSAMQSVAADAIAAAFGMARIDPKTARIFAALAARFGIDFSQATEAELCVVAHYICGAWETRKRAANADEQGASSIAAGRKRLADAGIAL